MNNQSIKDFNVGEKAYVVYANIGYNSPPRMKEVIITKVGRKYVTVKGLESYSSNIVMMMIQTYLDLKKIMTSQLCFIVLKIRQKKKLKDYS